MLVADSLIGQGTVTLKEGSCKAVLVTSAGTKLGHQLLLPICLL